MKTLAFPRKARLKSKIAIDRLFGQAKYKGTATDKGSCLCYPLRAAWIEPIKREENDTGIKVLISVPKKRIRKAVERVVTRRRIREAWRVQRIGLGELNLDMAIIYIADRPEPFEKIFAAVSKIICILHKHYDNEAHS